MAVGAMAQEPQQDNDDPAASELESSLSRALELRAPYIKGHPDQLTLISVRRLLERDLGLKNLYLEEHKDVIKGLVDKVLNGTDNDADGQDTVAEAPKKRRKKSSRVVEDLQDEELGTPAVDLNSGKKRDFLHVDKEKPTKTTVDEDNPETKDRVQDAEMPTRQGSTEMQSEKHEPVEEGPSKEDKMVPEDEGKAEETLAKNNEETILLDNRPSQDTQEASQPDSINTDENAIRVALLRRAAELKSQVATLTVTKVRHLLEDDLGLERDGLKVHKQFIRTLVDELIEELRGAPSEEPNIEQGKGAHLTEEEAPAKSKGRPKNKEVKSSMGRKSALREAIEDSEDNLQGNGEVSDSVSEERRANKPKKRKKKDNEVKTKLAFDKKSTDAKRPFSPKVERLREILKFVGIGFGIDENLKRYLIHSKYRKLTCGERIFRVSPIVYKKAKQAPEHEREEVLIKELENRLAQEGLSPNPTEKETKKVKARLEKKRDLDGIEHSNIVAEPRRSRAAANSWFAPRPNRYAQAADKDSDNQDSDNDSKPVVTGAMDD